MSAKTPRQQGFTLLEVLIALTLMAVLSLLSWRALDTFSRSDERLQASADETLRILRVLGQLENDLSRHATSEVFPAGAFGAEPPASVLPTGLAWESRRLTVLRSTLDGNWQHVVWSLEDGVLYRAAGAPAIALPLPAPQSADPLLGDVHAFGLRAWLPDQGWADTLRTQSTSTATGLELSLTRGAGEHSASYRKVVMLP